MDQMGSPFLLAHGLGRPVADAVTKVALAKGEYRVWVRKRFWSAGISMSKKRVKSRGSANESTGV